MTPLVALRGVTVTYGEVPALESATLNITAGDYVAIVGPSGSGKTTLLKTIAGGVRPTEGDVRMMRGLRLGYVPQVDHIDPYFPVTVMETVMMASRRTRLWPAPSKTEMARMESILRRLDLEGVASRHIRELSGGQRQRVFIARALMDSPHLLLLDEPTSGVDVATRHEVLHLLHDLNHDDKIAVVLTTHDLNGIAAHMHDVVCLNQKIIAAGAPDAILTPEVLEATYGAPMDVLRHGGMPVVVEHIESEHDALGPAHHDHP